MISPQERLGRNVLRSNFGFRDTN